jgi:CheY-like chemotaxis protein
LASVLIIDEDVTLLAGLGTQLEEDGYTVLKSSELRHAERLFAEERPDLVILDVRIDANRGWEVLPKMAAAAPVIVLSGASREEDVVRGFENGAVDYIGKPYRSAELRSRLRMRLMLTPMEQATPPARAVGKEPPPATPTTPKSATAGRATPAASAAPEPTNLAPPAAPKSPPAPPATPKPTADTTTPTPGITGSAPPAPPATPKPTADTTTPTPGITGSAPPAPPATPKPAADTTTPTPGITGSAPPATPKPDLGTATPASTPPATPRPAAGITETTPTMPAAAPRPAPTGAAPSSKPARSTPPVRSAAGAQQGRKPTAGQGSDDEAVFMSDAEEMALLRMAPARTERPKVLPSNGAIDGNASLGQRLRIERLQRHLTLVQVENDLKIRMSYLQALEDDKFTLLPRGPIAIQMVNTYASHLGLDAPAITEEFRQNHYVEPIEPPTDLGGTRMPRTIPRWVFWLIAIGLALVIGISAIFLLDPTFFQRLPEFGTQLWAWLQSLWPNGAPAPPAE